MKYPIEISSVAEAEADGALSFFSSAKRRLAYD
jgi:hypothetical protein